MLCDLRWSVEPPWGVEPQAYALRGFREAAPNALLAPTAPLYAPAALRDLGERPP